MNVRSTPSGTRRLLLVVLAALLIGAESPVSSRAATPIVSVAPATAAVIAPFDRTDLPPVSVKRVAAPAVDEHPMTTHRPTRRPPDRTASSVATEQAQTPAAASKKTSTPTASKPRYVGTNHVWFPAIGLSKQVYLFPCDRARPPDNYVYRWGCAHENNVYLLGHAATVFRGLHDLYTSHRLRVGMVVYYADGNGRIHEYAVTEWRVVTPDKSSWAIAAQPVDSMTLQTCVGDDLRLNVRLVAR